MTTTIVQFSLAFFGLAALFMAMGTNARHQRWAPIVGLLGQPFWLWFSFTASAWGLLALSLAYSAVYARGAWVQWSEQVAKTLDDMTSWSVR